MPSDLSDFLAVLRLKIVDWARKKIDFIQLVLGKLWSLCASSGSGHKSANYPSFMLDMSVLLFICLLLRPVVLNCRVCGRCSSFSSTAVYNECLCETCSCYQLAWVCLSGFSSYCYHCANLTSRAVNKQTKKPNKTLNPKQKKKKRASSLKKQWVRKGRHWHRSGL